MSWHEGQREPSILMPKSRSDLGAELVGDQVERVFVHGAALDGVDRPLVGAGVLDQSPLEHVDDGGLTARDRTHQEQDPAADVQPSGGRMEVLLHQALQRPFQAKQLLFEEAVPAVAIHLFHTVGDDHIVDAGMGVAGQLGVAGDHLEVLGEGPFPGEVLFLLAVGLQPLGKIQGVSPSLT